MNRFRKTLLSGAAIASLWAHAQTNVAINDDGSLAVPQALLDVKSTTKGVLIPRVASAAAIATPVPGLTVYQTGGTKGFYYFQAGVWNLIGASTGARWDLVGNPMTAPLATNPNTDFFGTTDNTDVVVRTNNVERIRFKATSGFVGVGTTTPLERLDVNGAVRMHQPLATTTPQLYSAGSTAGTMSYYAKKNTNVAQAGHYVSAAAGGLLPDTLLWNGHWGNITGVAPSVGSATVFGHAGGWRRLVNDYDEVYNRPWAHHAQATCTTGPGAVATIPRAISPVSSGTLPALEAERISPFNNPGAGAAARRFRVQYVYTGLELNLEQNLITAGGDPLATQGVCVNEPITAIAVNLEAASAISLTNSASFLTVTVKNVPAGLGTTAAIAGFDNGIDPLQGCASIRFGAGVTAPAGWYTITLATPFIWDGSGNVLVEFAGLQYQETLGHLQVQATPVARTFGAYSYGAALPGSACSPTTALNTAAPCYAATDYANNLGNTCGGSSMYRPLMRFTGAASQTAGAGTSGTANFLLATGGFISEVPVATGAMPWGRQTSPYYPFKGAGTIAAQRGVFDEGVRLNDHVFDRAFDGRVAASDAAEFGDRRHLSIPEMAEHTRTRRHLPTIRGRADWEREGGFSLGDLTNQLWVTTETQALYLTDLHDRLNALEVLSNDRPLKPEEARNARQAVCAMPELTDAEKAALAGSLQHRTITLRTNP